MQRKLAIHRTFTGVVLAVWLPDRTGHCLYMPAVVHCAISRVCVSGAHFLCLPSSSNPSHWLAGIPQAGWQCWRLFWFLVCWHTWSMQTAGPANCSPTWMSWDEFAVTAPMAASGGRPLSGTRRVPELVRLSGCTSHPLLACCAMNRVLLSSAGSGRTTTSHPPPLTHSRLNSTNI